VQHRFFRESQLRSHIIDANQPFGHPGGRREEDEAVMDAMYRLGFRCCGYLPWDRSGSNQFYVRVNCAICRQVCVRYRRH
jgi:hypothetical protein